MHHPPPTTPHPCPWRHYTGTWETNRQTDVVQWVDGWSVWRHHGDLMYSGFKVEGGFPGKLWEDLAWLWPCSEMGEEGSVGGGEQALQLTSGWRLYPAGHLTGFPGLWVGIRFGMKTWNFRVSVITSTILSRPARRWFFFSLLFALLSWWLLFVLLDLLWVGVRFYLPV